MRDADAEWISPEDRTVSGRWSQGLAPSMSSILRKRLRSGPHEVSERKQVGDAESMVNEGTTGGGDGGNSQL